MLQTSDSTVLAKQTNGVRELVDVTGPEVSVRPPTPTPGVGVHVVPPKTPGRGPVQNALDNLQMLFWRRLIYRMVQISSVLQPHGPPVDIDYVKPIPAGRRYPGLVDIPLVFSERTPASERHDPLESAVIKFTWWMKEWYAMGNRLTQPYTGIGAPYPDAFAKLQPRPTIPEDFQHGDTLAGVARRGPFSLQTKRIDDKTYVIDLGALDGLDPRPPFVAAGGVAYFQRDGAESLRTVGVKFRGALTRPGDAGWSLAKKRFLVGLNSYTTFVEHLLNLHIASAGTWGIVARMAFSTRHPLRVLLQPFTEETNRVNNYNIDGLLLTENSNVPLYSGYSLEQSDTLLRLMAAEFDVRNIDPELRAEAQGQIGGQVGDGLFPTVESAIAVYRIFRKLTEAWCREFLPTIDLETRIFCEELDHRVPNGIRSLIGIKDFGELTPAHVAHVLAVGAFAGSVGHHIVNDLTRNYFMSFHLMPPALDANGYPTLGVVMEKQESIVSAGIQRYKLVAQAYMPNERGRALWAEFQSALVAYENGIDKEPDALRSYRIHPSVISSSIHA